jgi:hypothetical protein
MNAAKKAKKKPGVTKRERKERRFSPEPTYSSRLVAYAGMAGALVLGAGVYAQWVREPPLAYAPVMVAVGAIVLAFALWKSSAELGNVRVGEAGVALEQGNELVRILWCDIERIALDGGRISVRSRQQSIVFPVEAHPKATTWLVSEAGRRVPDVVSMSRTEIEKFGEPKEFDGEMVTIEALQVTGRHCRASGKPIAFERDARLCPNCGETYLKDQVPKKCVTCQNELGPRAREV